MVMYYTGVLKDTVKKAWIPVHLKPQEIYILVLSVSDVEKLATVTLMEKFVPTVSGSQKLLASGQVHQKH
ncbi:hypothetical protein cypCar_00009617 [Cyprinus carpio]|nr:hypothetical protein cypCar_00009617 [Cyprinus carpio]